MSKRTLVNLVFFLFVFFVMIVWAVQNVVTIDAIDQPYELDGEFAAGSGVLPNAEVAFLGVNYGRVAGVERIAEGVRISMKIDDGKQIPKGSVARIFRKSAIGEPYIDFQPPAGYTGTGPFYAPGETVPKEDTQNPLEFSELLRSASALISRIDPAQAGSLIHELAQALEGRADSLRTLTQSTDELAATFAEQTDVLDRLATNNTRLTRVFAAHAGDFGQSITNLRLVADSLEAATGDATVLLDQGTQLFGQLADLVADEKGTLDCILDDLGVVIDATTIPSRLSDLSFLLDNGPVAFALVPYASDREADGVWARVNLLTNPENPPPQYDPPKELPPVPAVPGCTPNVPAGRGPTFRPVSVSGTLPGVASVGRSTLPATGGGLIGSAAVALVVAAIVARRLERADRRG